jgi:asparagine synthase (glutamine-hydrolysing)
VDGPLALAFLGPSPGAGRPGGQQPLASPSGRYLLALDGRLDNRAELIQYLEGPQRDRRRLSDAALLATLFDRRGDAALLQLVGSYVLALYDREDRSLLLARDAVGNRTLFYRLCANRLEAASEVFPLLTAPHADRRLDRESLAGYFALDGPPPGSTFFRGVRELRPGEALWLRAERVLNWSYDRLEPGRDPWTGPDRIAEERYRYLLRRSVLARRSSEGITGLMLSGGLDSSTLAALVSPPAGEPDNDPLLKAYSWTFDAFGELDERSFGRMLGKRYQLPQIEIPGDAHWTWADPTEYGGHPDTPEENPYRSLKLALYQRAASDGTRVLLNGGSADALYSGTRGWLRSRLRAGHWVSAAFWTLRQLRVASHGSALAALKHGFSAYPKGGGSRPAPPWLTASARRIVRELREERGSDSRSGALSALEQRGITTEQAHAARAGVEIRHPYRDRRLVEFFLSLPPHQLYRPGQSKSLGRRAMARLLPPAIAWRQDTADLSPLFQKGIREEHKGAVEELLLQNRAIWVEFVRQDWLEGVLRDGPRQPRDEVVLWNCIAFSHWSHRWLDGDTLRRTAIPQLSTDERQT